MRLLVSSMALLWVGALTSASARESSSWSVSSPNGNLALVVEMKDSVGSSSGTTGLSCRVLSENSEVLPSAPLGITLKRAGQFVENLRVVNRSAVSVNERYAMPVGKKSECVNRANELILDFANETGGKMSLILRAYDEGVAYRYRIHGTGQDTVLNEVSSFHVPAGSQGWFARYTQPHYEWYYDAHTTLTGIDYEVAIPALLHTPNGHWVYVTEAAVDGTYTGARLRFREAKGEILAFQLPEQPSSTLPWLTPWRVSIIGKGLATLVESTMVANLNPPAEIADTSWIKPGVDVIPWMTGPSVNNASFERMKQFVDLASEMGWSWIEFDNALALGNQQADTPDKCMGIPWIPEFVSYASRKGVNVYGWDHWRNLDTPEKRETILGYSSAWDDIHFVDGYPGEFAVLARRKGQDWWLVGINAGKPREVIVPLDFLRPATYRARLYHDAPARATVGSDVGANVPESDSRELALASVKTRIAVEDVTVDSASPFKVSMPANGGFGVKLEGSAREVQPH